MTILFVFFVLPLATILLAIVLQKILRNPILVGITFFAVYLIVAFTAFSANLAAAIIGAIILSVLAFITAVIIQFICILRQRFCDNWNNNNTYNGRTKCCEADDNNEPQTISDTRNLLRISCNCQNGESNDLLTINSNCNLNNNNDNDSDNSNSCGCNNREAIVINEQANPINTNIRRYCCNRGYRRF